SAPGVPARSPPLFSIVHRLNPVGDDQRNTGCPVTPPGHGHQIRVMRSHLAGPDDRGMDAASARYMIRITAPLGATLLSAFPAMDCERQGPQTVLTGVLDQPGLYGVLAEIESLGL